MDMSASKIDSQYIMLIGTPGTRKSTQALSYPKPQFWLSFDQKMNSLLLPMRAWGIDSKQIHYEDYKDWDAPRKKLEELAVNCPYKTIIIDSVTTAANAILRQTKSLKGADSKGKSIAHIQVNSIEDYNAESAALLELVALTKDIGKFHRINVILIAHLIQAEYKSNPNSESNIVRTIVTAGKRVAPMIPAYCEDVYHFFLKRGFDADKGGQHALLTSSTSEDFARTQLPLDKEIVFEDKPLYDTWIAPAIARLNKEK
jgi:hypothetical protein